MRSDRSDADCVGRRRGRNRRARLTFAHHSRPWTKLKTVEKLQLLY